MTSYTVTPQLAKFLADQLIGEHCGQMSRVPNNPLFQGLIAAHGITSSDYKGLAAFLRLAADQIEKQHEDGIPF